MAVAYLIGDPVEHSLSPAMQNAALRASRLAWQYELLETPRDRLGDAVARLRADDCAGANVTIPYKEAVLGWLDGLSENARQMGAVNTIIKREGKLIGENTDGYGFMQSLRDARIDVCGARAVILGAGGAARAVAFALADAGVASITIINRTAARAATLADALHQDYPNLALAVNRHAALDDATLIVNATPLGMSPHEDASPMPTAFPRGAVAFDLVCRPLQTPFRRDAERAGARTMGGIEMLVHQGAAAFKLWTGRDAPVDVMVEAAEAALRETEHAIRSP